MITFRCPACKNPICMPDDQQGTKIHCQGCGQKVMVPAPPPSQNKTMLGEMAPPSQHPVSSEADEQLVLMVDEDGPSRRRSDSDDSNDRPRRREDSRDTGLKCQYCRKRDVVVEPAITVVGWIVFVFLLVVFFPLCWIGLLIKEPRRKCLSCGMTM